ncbi:peroxisomal 2,4-dienoyl-CoA reductase [(3E)-enoyl-CoA-producing] isoform X2 [Octopus bimaculoides]|uniref:Peroxisomal 2,4-dienoyl-CoA reductase [(3E)-enoyl-CoA-producing] n=1 Tax=Octopus bimaculoides TaxID=37653 RepID=A0A0L8I6X4_OCTBM|nr:peroxisomal 2,4-dienoyl-CoA reductase [(3E)-enoyl-CoA-producing] isoform X2 [Octopus bimaculoides]|eukprot:XP_014789868.1 PREDICTED: peroxisomal 2,4-dienoyl-CoA reductase-like [Octopus bimaculoides]
MAASGDERVCLDYEYLYHPDLLKNKVAFITGGGSGICFTIAEIFMRHNCDTVIASRKLEKLVKSADILEKATGKQCLPIQADVRKPHEIQNAVDKSLQKFGKIDIVINGAAGNFLCLASNMSFHAFQTIQEIDTMGTFNVSKVVYEKYMRDHGGVILNITATQHYRGVPLQCHVGAAKSAIEALTKHLAVEWGPNGIRVLCIAPGPVSNSEGYRRLVSPEISEAMLSEHIPIGQIATRSDIANIAVFLVSKAAGLLTGVTVVADGGHWMGSLKSWTDQIMLAKKSAKL